MPKKTILSIEKDIETQFYNFSVSVNPIELSAILCCLMENDPKFLQAVMVAVTAFSENKKDTRLHRLTVNNFKQKLR